MGAGEHRIGLTINGQPRRVVNPKTARSQILGGVVWGVGMALHEEAGARLRRFTQQRPRATRHR
ncbi:molybdopterin-dependent oxidoreductase [Pseudomonas putida]|nr:molybdopterin-dependent oxidoreductase [Pseudomonas putida]